MNVTFKCSALACAVVTLAVQLGGCGDDKNSRPVFTAGVQAADGGADASVSTLSDEQREQLCENRKAYVDANLNLDILTQARCLAGAVILGGSADECQANLDRCVAASGDSSLGVSVEIEAPFLTGRACADELRECQASVADLEVCVNANTGIVYELLDILSCRRSGDSAATNEAQRLKGAMGCTGVGTRCAGFSDPVLR